MANKRFGDTLRELRKSRGLTQQQASDLLGLKNKSTLGSWEVGKSEPDGYTLLKLCKIYEVDDIYRAFEELPPRHPTNNQQNLLEKYEQLNDEYKQFIEKQIDQLLKIQAKRG